MHYNACSGGETARSVGNAYLGLALLLPVDDYVVGPYLADAEEPCGTGVHPYIVNVEYVVVGYPQGNELAVAEVVLE